MAVDKSISITKSTIQIIFLNFFERIHEISSDNPSSQHLLKDPLLQGFFLPCCSAFRIPAPFLVRGSSYPFSNFLMFLAPLAEVTP